MHREKDGDVDDNKPTAGRASDAGAAPTAAAPVEDAGEDAGEDGIARRLKDAWMKTLGAYATDEKGAASLFHRLVGFGALSAEEAKKVVAETRAKIEQNKKDLDAQIDQSIQSTVGRFVDPAATELRRLADRLAQMESRVKKLEDDETSSAA